MAGNEAGEAESGVFWGFFLEIGGFMGFIDNNEAEVMDGGEEGGTGADDDLRCFCNKEIFPDFLTFYVSEARVNEGDAGAKSCFKNPNKLGG